VSDLITLAVEKRDIIDELVRAGVHTSEMDAPIKEKLNAQVEVLLHRAQAAGAVRQDVNIVDLSTLLMGTCMAAGQQGAPSVRVAWSGSSAMACGQSPVELGPPAASRPKRAAWQRWTRPPFTAFSRS